MPDYYRHCCSVSGSRWHSSARRTQQRHQRPARVYGNNIFLIRDMHTQTPITKVGKGTFDDHVIRSRKRTSWLSVAYRSFSRNVNNKERLLCMFHFSFFSSFFGSYSSDLAQRDSLSGWTQFCTSFWLIRDGAQIKALWCCCSQKYTWVNLGNIQAIVCETEGVTCF